MHAMIDDLAQRKARYFATTERAQTEKRTPAEVKAQADAMSVALAQPHRRGNSDPRLSEPLGRFCEKLRLKASCYAAGLAYAELIKLAKIAMGLSVPGSPGEGGICDLTDGQLQARKELALQRRRQANEVLSAIMARLPARMEGLCFDQSEPSPYDEGSLRAGLFALAVHFGMEKLGINAGKPV